MSYTCDKKTQVVYEVEIDEPILSPVGDRLAYEAQMDRRYRFVWLSGLWKPKNIINWLKARNEKVKSLKANHVYFYNGKGGCQAVPLNMQENN